MLSDQGIMSGHTRCVEIEIQAIDVREGDYVVHFGTHHILKREVGSRLVCLVDSDGCGHLYHPRTLLHVARPVE